MKALQAHILHIDYETFERRFLWGLCSSAIVLGTLYSLFVSISITNIVMREEIGQTTAEIEEALSGLESEYLTRTNAIQKEYAYSLGFVDITNTAYVTRAPRFEHLTVAHE